MEPNDEKDLEKKQTRGGRNLLIMGILAIIIAISTTSVSLAIYHNSGDIYLDRSRPGFLPDEGEIEADDDIKEDYTFSKSGALTEEVLEEYLKNLKVQEEGISEFEKPFDEKVLSDEHLGITSDGSADGAIEGEEVIGE